METGVFPEHWECARVTPLFKSGSKCYLSNNRPISVLPVLSKLLEKILRDQLYRGLVAGDVLSEWQFGLRPGFSTATAASYFVDAILTGMDIKRHRSIAVWAPVSRRRPRSSIMR